MFLATVVPRSQMFLMDDLTDKTVYYPSNKEHLVVVANADNIPLNIQEQMQPILYNTGFVSPIRAYQHLEYLETNLTPDAGTEQGQHLDYKSDPEINRKLMALRSELAYAATELLGPDRFYFKLETQPNEVGTKRIYNYRLIFTDTPCYYLEGDDIFEQMRALLPEVTIGPLICSSYTLNMAEMNPPQWYLREIFRDLCELQDIDMNDKVLLEGPLTGELYLFYNEVVNVTEDQLEDISEDINDVISSNINAKIFPRRTPRRFAQNRQLVAMQNGQYTTSVSFIDNDLNLFQEHIQISFSFKRVVDLFWFLFWLMLAPTYSFIEKEFQIEVHAHQINVKYYTEYYPDYLRVMTASRAKAPEAVSQKAQLYYLESLSTKYVNEKRAEGPFVNFYDHAQHQTAMIVNTGMDKIKWNLQRSAPINYTLETRLKHDYQLQDVLQIANNRI